LVKFPVIFRRWLRHQRIAFDTSFLIPILEDDREKGGIAFCLTRMTEKRSIFLVTSTMTLLEVLVHPYRRGDDEDVTRFFSYLTEAPSLQLIPLTSQIADWGAELRARYGFKTPDAVQLATALAEGATLFLTRDREFQKQKEIEVGIL